jgi:SAM-dependent methyltransferase
MKAVFDASFWDNRYAATGYVYGTGPNEFLAAVADHIPPGPVLCLAEGEGRNAVHLARRGHAVTAVDQSAVGLAKARALAEQNGVSLTTQVADLSVYVIPPLTWSGIVVIFMHLPPALRAAVLAQAVAGLRPGGVLVLECYSPAQLAFDTGGPRDVALLPTLAALRTELAGLDLLHGQELERDIL